MAYDFASLSTEELNVKVAEFMNKYSTVIKSAAKKVGLDSYFAEDVVIELAQKYANGKLQFDSSKGVTEKAYISFVARNAAINMKRQNTKWEEPISIDDDDTFKPVEHEASTEWKSELDTEDKYFIFTEAMKRLSKEYGKVYTEIFVRSSLQKENYNDLAAEYHMNASTVASKLSRMRKRTIEISATIRFEEDNGCFIRSTNSIDFLRPYLGDFCYSRAA